MSKAPGDLRGAFILLMRKGDEEVSYYDPERSDALLIHCEVLG